VTDTVNSRKRFQTRRLLAAAAIGVTLGCLAAPIVVSESTLHIQVRPLPDRHEADAIARGAASTWQSARIAAADGVTLDGWLFTPRDPNGSGVILLHGVGDTRAGMAGYAAFLLRAGYAVLVPDLRGHGASGGSVISYGIREASDVHVWADWLLRERPIAHLYGLGRSLGAAILIESLAREPRFRALVADCPFDSFEDVAYYRLEHASGLGRWATREVVETGFLYARLVYTIDLRQAPPARAIRSATTPILLIHGTADTNIPPSESEALHSLNPRETELWLVPGAGHIGSLSRDPLEYVRRVTEWFASHP